MNPNAITLVGCKCINVIKNNGELIASIPLDPANDGVIEKNGYSVVFEKKEPKFQGKNGKVYLVKE